MPETGKSALFKLGCDGSKVTSSGHSERGVLKIYWRSSFEVMSDSRPVVSESIECHAGEMINNLGVRFVRSC